MRERTGRAHRLILCVLPCPDWEGFVRLQVAATGSGIPLDCLTRGYSQKDPGLRIYSRAFMLVRLRLKSLPDHCGYGVMVGSREQS